MLLKNQWVNKEIKGEIKKYFETNDNEKQPFKIYGMLQKQHSEGNSKQYRPSSRKKNNLKSRT